MGKKGLTNAFIELEEAVDRLLSRGGGSEGGVTGKAAGGALKRSPETSFTEKEAAELIRKAIERLKALY